MAKNENLSESILGDLQDMVKDNNQDTYFDALDDLLIIAKNFSTNKKVKAIVQSLMDKQTADKDVYAKSLTKIDKYLHPEAYYIQSLK